MKTLKEIVIVLKDVLSLLISFLLVGIHMILQLITMFMEFIDGLNTTLARIILGTYKSPKNQEQISNLTRDLKGLPEYIVSPIENVLLNKLLTYYLTNKISLANALSALTTAITQNSSVTDELIRELKLNVESKDLLITLFKRISAYEYIKKYNIPDSLKVRIAKSKLSYAEVVLCTDTIVNTFDVNINRHYSWTDPTLNLSLVSYFTADELSNITSGTKSSLMYYNQFI